MLPALLKAILRSPWPAAGARMICEPGETTSPLVLMVIAMLRSGAACAAPIFALTSFAVSALFTVTLSSACAGLTAMSVESGRSEEHTSELQSLMRISYAVFCLKKKKHKTIRLQQY